MKKPRIRMRGYNAFTLVEVLATVALIAIVLPVAMYGIQLSVQVGSNARRQAEAATLAQGKLAELVAQMQSPVGGGNAGGGGDFGAEFPEYRWESTTSVGELNMEQVDVRVIWVARGQERSVGVSTWVYRTGGVAGL